MVVSRSRRSSSLRARQGSGGSRGHRLQVSAEQKAAPSTSAGAGRQHPVGLFAGRRQRRRQGSGPASAPPPPCPRPPQAGRGGWRPRALGSTGSQGASLQLQLLPCCRPVWLPSPWAGCAGSYPEGFLAGGPPGTPLSSLTRFIADTPWRRQNKVLRCCPGGGCSGRVLTCTRVPPHQSTGTGVHAVRVPCRPPGCQALSGL